MLYPWPDPPIPLLLTSRVQFVETSLPDWQRNQKWPNPFAPSLSDQECKPRGWGNPTRPLPYTILLHPTSYTLHPSSYTLHPTPYTLHHTPYTLHPTPYSIHPPRYTLHPRGGCRVYIQTRNTLSAHLGLAPHVEALQGWGFGFGVTGFGFGT